MKKSSAPANARTFVPLPKVTRQPTYAQVASGEQPASTRAKTPSREVIDLVSDSDAEPPKSKTPVLSASDSDTAPKAKKVRRKLDFSPAQRTESSDSDGGDSSSSEDTLPMTAPAPLTPLPLLPTRKPRNRKPSPPRKEAAAASMPPDLANHLKPSDRQDMLHEGEPRSRKFRNWFLTWNNPKEGDHALLVHILKNRFNARYLVVGDEVGEQGTPHLQGCFAMQDQKTMSALKRVLPEVHWEACKSLVHAADYCKKEGKFTEWGTPPDTPEAKGKKEQNRWKFTLECCKAGNFDAIEPVIQITHARSLDFVHARAVRARYQPDNTHLENYWFVGATGTGKSRLAREWFENDRQIIYDKPLSKWMNGYEFQPVWLLEDVDPHGQKDLGGLMKRWSDRYPVNAETKGGSMEVRPQIVIVTSNYFPHECFPDPGTHIPLQRRFTIVWFGDQKECISEPDRWQADLPSIHERLPEFRNLVATIRGSRDPHHYAEPAAATATESDDEEDNEIRELDEEEEEI
jgi:hypothetical protein